MTTSIKGMRGLVAAVKYTGKTSLGSPSSQTIWRHKTLFLAGVVFSFASALLSLGLPLFFYIVYRVVVQTGASGDLPSLVGIVGVVILGIGISDYISRRSLARFASRFQVDLEKRLIRSELSGSGSKKATYTGTRELDELRSFLHSGVFRNLIDALWLPMFAGVLFLVNVPVALLVCTGIVIFGLLHFFGNRWILRDKDTLSELAKDSKQAARNLASAAKLLSQHSLETSAGDDLIEKRNASRNAAIRSADMRDAFKVTLSTFRFLLSIFVLALAAGQVVDGNLTIGGMIACVVVSNRFQGPAMSLIQNMPIVLHAIENWKALEAKLDADPSSKDTLLAIDHAVPLLELKDVIVRSDPKDGELLSGVNFKVGRGEVVQIIGPPGSGKSALCAVLAWSTRPKSGLVLGYGRRMSELGNCQRAALLGYVPEIPHFLNASIAQNISRLQTDQARADVIQAARRVGLAIKIDGMAYGYATELKENGTPLCRNDRDLLSLARALFAEPDLLVIDQPSQTVMDLLRGGAHGFLEDYIASGGSVILALRHDVSLGVPSTKVEIANGTVIQHPRNKLSDAKLYPLAQVSQQY